MNWRTPLALVLVACSSPAPAAPLTPPGPQPDAAPLAAVPASPPDAGALASTTEVDAGPPPPEARPAPSEPALVFRRIMGGMLPYPGTRETWTIEKYDRSEVVVRLAVDEAKGSVQILGPEREAATWHNVGEIAWTGTMSDLHVSTVLRLESKRGAWGSRNPRVPPGTLKVQCKTIELPVLAGTAKLLRGDACGNGGKRPAWSPPGKTRTKVERCTFPDLDPEEPGGGGDGWSGQPSFAREPGVEWVFDNSDCSAQEGAYRLISPPKAKP